MNYSLKRIRQWLVRFCEIVTRQECASQRVYVAEAERWMTESHNRVQAKTTDVRNALVRLNTSL
jgi:hypothetical protein